MRQEAIGSAGASFPGLQTTPQDSSHHLSSLSAQQCAFLVRQALQTCHHTELYAGATGIDSWFWAGVMVRDESLFSFFEIQTLPAYINPFSRLSITQSIVSV